VGLHPKEEPWDRFEWAAQSARHSHQLPQHLRFPLPKGSQLVSGDWWRSAVIYQIYPRSFADSNGDGIGDLPGITRRLDHLSDLGVDAVWLSPFYTSPQDDAGYDVADYRNVDPLFGDLGDAEELIREAHARAIRVIVDLVPNHTSDEHVWFQQALSAEPRSLDRERYIFRPGKGPAGDEPPNDWTSEFGGPAWTRTKDADGQPGEWFLHMFSPRQPDLNWDFPEVRTEFVDILRFWLDRGVDGFRIDVAHGLVKEPSLPDWPHVRGRLIDFEGDHPRIPMYDQDGVHDIYREWHRTLEEYGGQRILVAEAYVAPEWRLARYLRPDEMQQAFNFEFLVADWDATAFRNIVTSTLNSVRSVAAAATWVLSNHDVVRHPSRYGMPSDFPIGPGLRAAGPQPDEALGLRRGRAATLLLLALPGGAYLYQGEELGLPEQGLIPDELRQDPGFHRGGGGGSGGRDGCRVPIPWEADSPSFGFGPTAATWLPQPAGWRAYALDQQAGVPGSTYEMYRAALQLRRKHELGTGAVEWLELGGPGHLAFRNGGVLVVVNVAGEPVELPAGWTSVLRSDQTTAGPVATDSAVWAVRD
jgi:alpha-glucosidase